MKNKSQVSKDKQIEMEMKKLQRENVSFIHSFMTIPIYFITVKALVCMPPEEVSTREICLDVEELFRVTLNNKCIKKLYHGKFWAYIDTLMYLNIQNYNRISGTTADDLERFKKVNTVIKEGIKVIYTYDEVTKELGTNVLSNFFIEQAIKNLYTTMAKKMINEGLTEELTEEVMNDLIKP